MEAVAAEAAAEARVMAEEARATAAAMDKCMGKIGNMSNQCHKHRQKRTYPIQYKHR